MISKERAKEAASLRALELVDDGMILGLGTGTTAAYFISHLIEKCRQGLHIHAVATSINSENLARAGNIPMLDINHITSIDLTVDGADQIDLEKRLIKGAGGALVREKIIAYMSREMVVIADESKLVDKLGKCLLPLEVIRFGAVATRRHLERWGYRGTFRLTKEGKFFETDNHHWILDISLPEPIDDPQSLHNKLLSLPGIVDTGLFLSLASQIIVGRSDGTTFLRK